jgi:hypothetical protein
MSIYIYIYIYVCVYMYVYVNVIKLLSFVTVDEAK